MNEVEVKEGPGGIGVEYCPVGGKDDECAQGRAIVPREELEGVDFCPFCRRMLPASDHVRNPMDCDLRGVNYVWKPYQRSGERKPGEPWFPYRPGQ